MDMMRSFSVQRMQLSDDPDDWCWVRWKPAVPGARPLPFMHAYGFPLWEDDPFGEPAGPQIHMFPSSYRPSARAIGDGTDFVGEPEWFQNGLPKDQREADDVVPLCGAEGWDTTIGLGADFDVAGDDMVVYARGGQKQGGYADFGKYRTVVGSGGQKQGGASIFSAGGYQTAEGGQAQGGYSLFGTAAFIAGTGGQAQGGYSLWTQAYAYEATGGQAQGGHAEVSAAGRLLGTGGAVQGGRAALGAGYVWDATGGQEQGGESAFRAAGTTEGSGGLRQGGYAAQGSGTRWIASGGSRQGGDTFKQGVNVPTTVGGSKQGGYAVMKGGAAFVASGGSRQGGSAQQGEGPEVPLPGYIYGYSYVAAQESTTSAAQVDLATVQAVTFTLDKAETVMFEGFAICQALSVQGYYCSLKLLCNGQTPYISQVVPRGVGESYPMAGAVTLALPAGTYTAKLQFNTGGGNAGFSARSLKVIKLQ